MTYLQRLQAKRDRRALRLAASNGVTVDRERVHLTVVREEPAEEYPTDVVRPKTRGDCENGVRPCPFVSCKHNLYLDVMHNMSLSRRGAGEVVLSQPGVEPDEMAESCALDVADRGGASLYELAPILNVSPERVRQLEAKILQKARKRGLLREWR